MLGEVSKEAILPQPGEGIGQGDNVVVRIWASTGRRTVFPSSLSQVATTQAPGDCYCGIN